MRKNRRLRRMQTKNVPGSMTVEAAFLMPLVMVCVVFLLYMGFYWYNGALCTSACRRASRALAAGTDTSAVSEEKEQLCAQGIGLSGVQLAEEQDGDSVTVTASAVMYIPFFGKRLTLTASQTAYVLDQRAFIMQCMLLQGLIQ